MSTQKFYASPRDALAHPNGAIGYRPGGPLDCLGPYAKVSNCPIDGTTLRLTAYATGYADTFFSVPACTRYRGRYISGYFTNDDNGVKFCPYVRHWKHLGIKRVEVNCTNSGRYYVTVDGVTDDGLAEFSDYFACVDAATRVYPTCRIIEPRNPLHSSHEVAK